MKSINKLSIFFIFLISAKSAVGDTLNGSSSHVDFFEIFDDVGANFVNSFGYGYGAYQFGAIGSTYLMVQSEWDAKIQRFSSQHRIIPYAGFPSVIAGGIVPIFLPLGLYKYGENEQTKRTGLALGQAALVAVTMTSTYKAITGRREPQTLRNADDANDYSHQFKFGFLRNGIFHGWPSGHAMVAFAMGTTLADLYPDNTSIQIASYSYATFVAVGISTNIHWASDGVAGGLMGYAIGKTVARSFKSRWENKKEALHYGVGPGFVAVNYQF